MIFVINMIKILLIYLEKKKTGEMYDVVKKLLKEIEDSMPTIEINLNDK